MILEFREFTELEEFKKFVEKDDGVGFCEFFFNLSMIEVVYPVPQEEDLRKEGASEKFISDFLARKKEIIEEFDKLHGFHNNGSGEVISEEEFQRLVAEGVEVLDLE